MNLLGIDYGYKRVGLAFGSDETKAAEPLETLVNDDGLLTRLRQIISDRNVGKLVVGLPRGLEGQPTQQTRVVEEFVAQVLSELQIPIETVDEAVTSEVARQTVGPAAPKTAVDAEAAAIILRDYLNQ